MGILGITKVSSENVYNIISLPEIETAAKLLGDCQGPSETASKLQKESETFFSSTSDGLPRQLIGLTPEDWFDRVGRGSENEFRHISVTALPPCLPWGFTLSTHTTLPTLATHGQARSRQAWSSLESVCLMGGDVI